jgi:hypothetical protein
MPDVEILPSPEKTGGLRAICGFPAKRSYL